MFAEEEITLTHTQLKRRKGIDEHDDGKMTKTESMNETNYNCFK